MNTKKLGGRFKIPTMALTSRFWSSETLVLVTFALVVEIGAGLGTVIIVCMIAFSNTLIFGSGKLMGLPGTIYVILFHIISGLIVGPLVHLIAPEAKGHGVPEVLTVIATKGGQDSSSRCSIQSTWDGGYDIILDCTGKK